MAVLEDLSHICVSEVVRPRAVAEPGRPGVHAAAPSEVWEAGCRVTRFFPVSRPKGGVRHGLWFLGPTAVLSWPRSCPFPFCRSHHWVPYLKRVTRVPSEKRPGLPFIQLPHAYFY